MNGGTPDLGRVARLPVDSRLDSATGDPGDLRRRATTQPPAQRPPLPHAHCASGQPATELTLRARVSHGCPRYQTSGLRRTTFQQAAGFLWKEATPLARNEHYAEWGAVA